MCLRIDRIVRAADNVAPDVEARFGVGVLEIGFEVGGEEGAAAVAVVEAIVRSSESGAPAEVERI